MIVENVTETQEEFLAYVREILLPDLIAAGYEGTSSDIKRLLEIAEGAQ